MGRSGEIISNAEGFQVYTRKAKGFIGKDCLLKIQRFIDPSACQTVLENVKILGKIALLLKLWQYMANTFAKHIKIIFHNKCHGRC